MTGPLFQLFSSFWQISFLFATQPYGLLSVWPEAITGQRWMVSWDAERYRPYASFDWKPLPLWAQLFHYWIESHLHAYAEVPKALALSVLQEVAEELLEEGFLWMLESGQSALR